MPTADQIPPSAAPVAPVHSYDGDNLMVQHYNDQLWNDYAQDHPGQLLSQQLKESGDNGGNRKDFGIYIRKVPKMLTTKGLENLCNKYGKAKKVRIMTLEGTWTNAATVSFGTVADAENVIKNINLLQSEKNGRRSGMVAEFQRPKKDWKVENESDNVPMPQFQPEEVNKEFEFKLTNPPSLDSFEPKRELDSQPLFDGDQTVREFDDVSLEILRDSGFHSNYSHSSTVCESELEKSKQSKGTFDEDKNEFVHNAALEFAETGECKNCRNSTIKFCKGCKDFFCSLHCLVEYNREKSGCHCITAGTVENKAHKPNRNSIGRGAKLLRAISIRSLCSQDSDTRSNGSSSRLSSHSEQNNESTMRTVAPCDLPLNNKMVTIVRVISHNTLFLRSVEPKDDEKFIKYINDVAEYGKIAPPLNKAKNGDIVVADLNGCDYRAMIAEIRNDEAVVAFLELCWLAKIPLSSLKKLREDLRYEKRFVFKATLSGVNGGLKSDKCLAYLQKFVEKGTELLFVGGKVCELRDETSNKIVNVEIAKLNAIKTGSKPVMEDDITVKFLDADVSAVIVINNALADKGFLTVISSQHASDLFLLHQRIQEYCKEDYESPYTPIPQEVCLVKLNDQWYRAKIEKSFGDQNPVMLLIDFAVYNKVNVNNIRRMPWELALPRFSAFAEIGGAIDTENTDMTRLPDEFPLLVKLSVIKLENPTEPKIYFDKDFSLTPRQRLLKQLKRNQE